jgi:NADH-quinone oxidoreductase subunit J
VELRLVTKIFIKGKWLKMFIVILFALSTFLCVGGALAIMVTKNIIHSCIYLLATLLGVAGLYVTLGADFIAATQIMVYVGGVVILMLFAVMLTGGQNFIARKKLASFMAPVMGSPKTFFIGGLTASVFILASSGIIGRYMGFIDNEILPYRNTVEELGSLLVTNHVLAFEIVSVLLLGALVGAAIIARPVKTLRIKK